MRYVRDGNLTEPCKNLTGMQIELKSLLGKNHTFLLSACLMSVFLLQCLSIVSARYAGACFASAQTSDPAWGKSRRSGGARAKNHPALFRAEIEIEIRGRRYPAELRKKPLYQKS